MTAFAMAGGGSLGAVEVGMLQAVLAWGEAPAFVVGASAGAINGAFFAAEPTPAGVARLGRIWSGLKRQDVFPFNLRSVPSLCPLACSPYDYSAAAPLVAQAAQSTQHWLEEGGLERAGVPMELQEHRH